MNETRYHKILQKIASYYLVVYMLVRLYLVYKAMLEEQSSWYVEYLLIMPGKEVLKMKRIVNYYQAFAL